MKKFTKGDCYSEPFKFSQSDVEKFADLTGDKNPIHINKVYASKSIFGRRIIHGFLGASIFSKVLATNFPGEGTIYLKQDMRFFSPMFPDENYLAKFKITKIIPEKRRALIETIIFDENDKLIVKGEALVQNNKYL